MHLKSGTHRLSVMNATLTIRLPPGLRRETVRAAKHERLSRSEFIRRALRHELWALAFEQCRWLLAPRARAKGIYTDKDVFKALS